MKTRCLQRTENTRIVERIKLTNNQNIALLINISIKHKENQMHLFEVTQKTRYTASSLSQDILSVWEKENISKKEMDWLKRLSVQSKLTSMLIGMAKKYGYTGNYEANHAFLDNAAQCASAYSVLDQVRGLIRQ